MHLTYKACELCSHYKVCGLRERYESVIEEFTNLCGQIEHSDEDFEAEVDCKHFDRKQIEVWR